ncbi:MAG: hypothetical protein U0894_06100 [Pirellulales bacterium]
MLVTVTPAVKKVCDELVSRKLVIEGEKEFSPGAEEGIPGLASECGVVLRIAADRLAIQIVGNLDRDDEYWGDFSIFEIGRIASGQQLKMAVATRSGGC